MLFWKQKDLKMASQKKSIDGRIASVVRKKAAAGVPVKEILSSMTNHSLQLNLPLLDHSANMVGYRGASQIGRNTAQYLGR
jgi:hypothetical protein